MIELEPTFLDGIVNCVQRQLLIKVILSLCTDLPDRIAALNAVPFEHPAIRDINCWFSGSLAHRDLFLDSLYLLMIFNIEKL